LHGWILWRKRRQIKNEKFNEGVNTIAIPRPRSYLFR
jgi:hypothetical protein